ncbi:MAG TPA: hypothetical protein VEZ11_09210 [Thermoanaerobaculia bacterium]|nr:hypothetical protein [Thermoanaerobaculia bacterium]
MAVRGEEVAGSIDAHVREAIERMVGEIRSSVEDVRVAVDQQLKAALQSVQADVNSITFLPKIKKVVGDFEDELTAELTPASTPAAATATSAASVKSAIQAIERGKTQVDILNALLEQCLGFGSRAALLILRGDTFNGWKGAGFTAHGGSDEAVKRFSAAPGTVPELDQLIRENAVVNWDGVSLAERLGATASETAILVPMVIKDKVAAAVFVDATADDIWRFDPASIELLVFTTGLLVDTVGARKMVPSPSLSGGESTAQAATEVTHVPAPAPAPRPPAPAPPPPPATPAPPAIVPPTTRVSPPAPPPSHPAAPPAAAPPPPSIESTVAIPAQQMRELITGARPTFNIPTEEDFGGSAPAPSRPAPPIHAAPSIEPPARPASPLAPPAAPGAGDERPSTQYIPPAGVGRSGALGMAPTEEAKKHDEARRFARLLVSEIKLYNEAKVDQGRKNRDLYERLKEDIDRSRQMYDERIQEDVRKVSNYFYEELVRILADGDADALGL